MSKFLSALLALLLTPAVAFAQASGGAPIAANPGFGPYAGGGGSSFSAATAADVQAGTSSTLAVTPAALAGSAVPQTLTYSATPAWNMALGPNASITLTGNVTTFPNPTNIQQGMSYALTIIQDGTGSRLVSAWGSYFNWGAGGAPTLTTTAGGGDLFSCYAVTTTSLWCSAAQGLTTAVASDVQAGTSSTKLVTPAALAGSAVPQTITWSATPAAWNMASGYSATITLTGSVTSWANPTNIQQGITYTLQVVQGGSGSYTVAWPAYFSWGTAGAPTLTTTVAAIDLVTCYAATTTKLLCAVNKGF